MRLVRPRPGPAAPGGPRRGGGKKPLREARTRALLPGMPSLSPGGILFLGLVLLMAGTRFGHFGTLLSLPDASWAIFLLGGFYLGRWEFFGLLFLEAVLIDWWSIALGGVSGWCITPAYLFLLPAYAALWGGGVGAARALRRGRRMLPLFAVLPPLAAALAFGISNLGFYRFSGHFGEMGVLEYAARVSGYLPGYLATTAGWVAAAVLLHGAVLLYRQSARGWGSAGGA